jgi:hypothetical protein
MDQAGLLAQQTPGDEAEPLPGPPRRAAWFDASRGVHGRNVRRLAIVGVVLLALLNSADVVTTRLLLTHAAAGAVEANPVAKALLASGSLLWVKLGIIALLGIAALRDRPKLGLLVGIWFTAGLYGAAVLSNILLLRMV